MTQHMIPSIRRDWILGLQNVFLIRHPARVLASYSAKREHPTLEDIGFSQQLELIKFLERETGAKQIVVDSIDIRNDPKNVLSQLCSSIGIPFELEMLSWPKGGHPNDGVWAPHWYGAVWNSEGFSGAEGPFPEVSSDLETVYAAALRIYEEMSEMCTIR